MLQPARLNKPSRKEELNRACRREEGCFGIRAAKCCRRRGLGSLLTQPGNGIRTAHSRVRRDTIGFTNRSAHISVGHYGFKGNMRARVCVLWGVQRRLGVRARPGLPNQATRQASLIPSIYMYTYIYIYTPARQHLFPSFFHPSI